MRINELARELEIPSKQVIEALPKIGIADKKSHSSKVEPDEAEKIRNYFRATSDAEKPPGATSRVSRDGDVLKAIQQKQAEPPSPARPVARPAAPPAAAKAPATPTAPAKSPTPPAAT